MLLDVLVVLVLILANGLFSGAEIAVLTLRKTRLAELVAQRRRGAAAVQRLRDRPEAFLATVQIGITVVGASAAAFGGETFADDLRPVLAGAPVLARWADELALVVVVSGVSFLTLVLGELVPKSLALRAPERYSLVAAPALWWLSGASRPLVWLLTATSNLVLRGFRDRTSFTESRLSPQEIQELVEQAAKVGQLDGRVSEIASRALGIRNLAVRDVMVPRTNIRSIDISTDRASLAATLSEHRFARLPVIDGNIDHAVGYLSVKELAPVALREGELRLESLVRPVLFVPASVAAIELFARMSARRIPVALVVDATGGVEGLVCVEDLVEEVMGEVHSETELTVEMLHREPDGSTLVLGIAPVREVSRALDLMLPEAATYTTMAGLCIELAGRIPDPGTKLDTPEASLEVVDATPARVVSVRVRAKPTPA